VAKAIAVEEPLSIENFDDLRRAIRDVQEHNEPIVFEAKEVGIAVLSPPRRPKRRKMTPEERERADYEAFLSAAGSWKGHLDVPEEFKRQIKAGRGSRRRFVEITLPDE
jgi:hypothetical protein